MRVLSTVTALVALTSCSAFIPQAPKQPVVEKTTKTNGLVNGLQKLMLVPALVLGVSGSTTFMPAPALADGAVSAATVTRAGALYGPRVIGLKKAVEKGDFAAIAAEDGAARLFNSGAFAMNRPQQKKVQAAYAEVQAAVKKQDAGALKTAWSTYFKTAGLDKTNPFSKKDRGQVLSSDFAYTLKNSNFQDE